MFQTACQRLKNIKDSIKIKLLNHQMCKNKQTKKTNIIKEASQICQQRVVNNLRLVKTLNYDSILQE